jgi:hypothetical protein
VHAPGEDVASFGEHERFAESAILLFRASSHFLVIGILHLDRELFTDSVNDGAGNMVGAIRQLGVLLGDGHCILRIVQVGRNVQALDGLLRFVENNRD